MTRETGGFQISKRIGSQAARRTDELGAPPLGVVRYVFRLSACRPEYLLRPKCHTFGIQSATKGPRIEKLYVINLDREPGRWCKMEEAQAHIGLVGSCTLERLSGMSPSMLIKFSEEPTKDADIDPFYTLGDQLFVEPKPLVLPTRLQLNTPIRMSRAEIAVARSHINVWRQIASGNHKYALILEDDVWFHFGFSRYLNQAWDEVVSEYDKEGSFDILYVSYSQVKYGAPKTFLSSNLFRPVRGLWHLSGYVLSRKGAKKLLHLLPCRGPIDLWVNRPVRRPGRTRD